jgi:hypothetical protein
MNDLYQSMACLLSTSGARGIEEDIRQRDGRDLDLSRVLLAGLSDDFVGAAADKD